MTVYFRLAGRLVKGRMDAYYYRWGTWHILVRPIGNSFKCERWITLDAVKQFDFSA